MEQKFNKKAYNYKGIVVARVATVMKWILKSKRITGLSPKPYKIILRYAKEIGLTTDLSDKHKIQDYCVKLFTNDKSRFYHCGNITNLPKILKAISEPTYIENTKVTLPQVPKKTWRDMPDKVDGKNNYAKYRAYINSNAWSSFRKEALKHHGKMCNRCMRDELPVEVHHITYERLFKELLMDVEILCKYCHQKEHTHRTRK